MRTYAHNPKVRSGPVQGRTDGRTKSASVFDVSEKTGILIRSNPVQGRTDGQTDTECKCLRQTQSSSDGHSKLKR